MSLARVIALYGELGEVAVPPIVELNRFERAATLTRNVRRGELLLARSRARGDGAGFSVSQ